MTYAEAIGQGASQGAIFVARVALREFRITASGLWTPDYADLHFGQLKAVLARARGSEGVRVLVDLREAAVQTASTADRVHYWTGSIYQAVDRVAMIATCELFLSEPEAVEWLRAI